MLTISLRFKEEQVMQMPKISIGREFVTITIPRDQLDRKFQGHLATSENKDLRLEELSILGRVRNTFTSTQHMV